MYEVFTQDHFSAAHRLINYKGNCSRWHGHNWVVKVVLQASELDEIGIAVDLRMLRTRLREVLKELDHSELNDHEHFSKNNPTCEVIAKYIYQRMSEIFNDDRVNVARVEIDETPNSGAVYYE